MVRRASVVVVLGTGLFALASGCSKENRSFEATSANTSSDPGDPTSPTVAPSGSNPRNDPSARSSGNGGTGPLGDDADDDTPDDDTPDDDIADDDIAEAGAGGITGGGGTGPTGSGGGSGEPGNGGSPGLSCPGKRDCAGECIALDACCGSEECPSNQSCVDHVCTCNEGTRACGELCIPDADCCDDDDCPEDASCGADGQCTCASGTHLCGSACVSNTSPDSCGSSCEPCLAPDGGDAACDGTQCQASCPESERACAGVCLDEAVTCEGQCPGDTHDCSGLCVSNTSVNGCGESCSPCPVPANGMATCDGTACGVTCNATFRECQGQCIPQFGCCGDADCQEDASCVNNQCRCDSGLRSCGSVCIPDSSCCDDQECQQNASCNGGTCECEDDFQLCNGACIDEAACCDHDDCPANGSCQSNSCVCDPGWFGPDCDYGFVALGVPNPTDTAATATAISADGSTVVGWSKTAVGPRMAFRWRNGQGQGLGTLTPGMDSVATAVSGDGSVVVGDANIIDPLNGSQIVTVAFEFTTTQMASLGVLSYGTYSEAAAISDSGARVVGNGDSDGTLRAVSWDSGAISPISMRSPFQFDPLEVQAISGDGAVVAGIIPGSQQPLIHTDQSDTALNALGSMSDGGVAGVNSDGSVITGYLLDGTTRHAIRWFGLNPADLGVWDPHDLSGDGGRIVGEQNVTAVLWDAVNGVREIAQVLTQGGVDLSNWDLNEAVGISADGRVIVGNGFRGSRAEPWLARLP